MTTPSGGGTGVPSDVVADLRSRYLDVLREHVPVDRPWLVVGASRKYNPGDAALALGSLAAGRAIGARFVPRTPGSRFRPEDVPPGAVVLIHGGGNFGGLYDEPHAMRMRVLTSLRAHRVVQLPQSIEFTDLRHRDELRKAIAEHGDVVVLARDQRSVERGREALECPVALSPDAAFGLGRLQRPGASEPVRVLRREDKESARTGAGGDVPASDWPVPPRASVRHTQRRALAALDRLSGRPGIGPVADRAAWRVWSALAASNFRVGRAEVGRAELLVTDRLHGHILACLAGVPHVVVNDGFGKVEAMWQTWTNAVPGATYVPTWADAADLLARRG